MVSTKNISDHAVVSDATPYPQTVSDYRVPQMREIGLRAIARYASRPMTKQMRYPVIAYPKQDKSQ